jgi:hypothetical protein
MGEAEDGAGAEGAGKMLAKELRSGVLKAIAGGLVVGFVAAAGAAWGIVKSWPGIWGLMPPGAVVAFPETCPSGWAEYRRGVGRMIVGAGHAYEDDRHRHWEQTQADGTTKTRMPLTGYDVRQIGGEETHILTVRELPAHNHSISTSTKADIHDGLAGGQTDYGIDQNYNPNAATTGGFGVLNSTISPTGQNAAHNNVPPYLALYWCAKT